MHYFNVGCICPRLPPFLTNARSPGLALTATVSVLNIGAVERAERTPSIVQAERLARVLGTTLSEMFVEVEPEVIPS